jgi:hypothetical protein
MRADRAPLVEHALVFLLARDSEKPSMPLVRSLDAACLEGNLTEKRAIIQLAHNLISDL